MDPTEPRERSRRRGTPSDDGRRRRTQRIGTSLVPAGLATLEAARRAAGPGRRDGPARQPVGRSGPATPSGPTGASRPRCRRTQWRRPLLATASRSGRAGTARPVVPVWAPVGRRRRRRPSRAPRVGEARDRPAGLAVATGVAGGRPGRRPDRRRDRGGRQPRRRLHHRQGDLGRAGAAQRDHQHRVGHRQGAAGHRVHRRQVACLGHPRRSSGARPAASRRTRAPG